MCNGPNHDPIAQNDTASGTEDTAVTEIAKSLLLSNDSDVDLDTLSVKSVSNAVGGSAAISSGPTWSSRPPTTCAAPALPASTMTCSTASTATTSVASPSA